MLTAEIWEEWANSPRGTGERCALGWRYSDFSRFLDREAFRLSDGLAARKAALAEPSLLAARRRGEALRLACPDRPPGVGGRDGWACAAAERDESRRMAGGLPPRARGSEGRLSA
ncbi:MAG: hypothetical protein ACODAD_06380 [Planctomycetota bacterium]